MPQIKFVNLSFVFWYRHYLTLLCLSSFVLIRHHQVKKAKIHSLPRSYSYGFIFIEVKPHSAVSYKRNISVSLVHCLLLKEFYNCYVKCYACVYRIVVYQNIMYVVFDSIVIFRSILLLAISNGCAKCVRNWPFTAFGTFPL